MLRPRPPECCAPHLTPELSRAAKRRRLGRIVRPEPEQACRPGRVAVRFAQWTDQDTPRPARYWPRCSCLVGSRTDPPRCLRGQRGIRAVRWSGQTGACRMTGRTAGSRSCHYRRRSCAQTACPCGKALQPAPACSPSRWPQGAGNPGTSTHARQEARPPRCNQRLRRGTVQFFQSLHTPCRVSQA